MKLAWDLKQDQLLELHNILTHDNFTSTGLNSDEKSTEVQSECASLVDYINEANRTAHEEKTKLDQHTKDLDGLRNKTETHPCPCVWDDWSDWSACSKTCGDGLKKRTRSEWRKARNNGDKCKGSPSQDETCNEGCCRKFTNALIKPSFIEGCDLYNRH